MIGYLYGVYGILFFLLQLLVAEALFARKSVKRDGSKWRLIIGFLLDILCGGVLMVCIFPVLSMVSRILVGCLIYFLLTLATIPGLYLCYDMDWAQLLLIVAEGYTLQHMASQISLAIRSIASLPLYDFSSILIEIAMFAVIYTLAYFGIVRNMSSKENLPVRVKYSYSVFMLLTVIVLSVFRDYYASQSQPLTLITRIFSILCCLCILLMLTGKLKNAAMNEDIETLQLLRKLELQQYERNKENVDLINIKCHDLKRQISVLEKSNTSLSSAEFERLRHAVDLYDSRVVIGNDVVDTILTEKSLICKENGIRMTTVANGESFDFMSPEDICAIFGNAIDNAIEAVLQIEDVDNRIITIKACEKMGMLVIEIENTYQGQVIFENNMPKTSKNKEKGFHGYGVKSIILAVKQYDGVVEISAEDKFRLLITIPITSKAQENL